MKTIKTLAITETPTLPLAITLDFLLLLSNPGIFAKNLVRFDVWSLL
jgi:hypothetical protein